MPKPFSVRSEVKDEDINSNLGQSLSSLVPGVHEAQKAKLK